MSEKCSRYSKYFNVCEFTGSMFLVIAAVSPIILFENILGAPLYIAVIADALAVGFVLFALIEIFGPICTSYFNPAVSIAMAIDKKITWNQVLKYSIVQILGGIVGVLVCHLMFYDRMSKIIVLSSIERSGGAYFAEIIGTFFLVLCIFSLVSQKSDRVSLVVGLLIGGMLLSTSSTMFANPQVTIARMFTYSSAGISPFNGVIFIFVEILGAAIAVFTWNRYFKNCSP